MGTYGSGLSRLDPGAERFVRYTNDPQDPASLADNSVQCVLGDSAGRIWVGLDGSGLDRLDPATGINSSRATGDFLGAAVPTGHGEWLLARRHQISRLDWRTGRMEDLVKLDGPVERLRFNDGKCDPQGRFCVGTMHRDALPGAAAFYQYGNRRLERRLDGVTIWRLSADDRPLARVEAPIS